MFRDGLVKCMISSIEHRWLWRAVPNQISPDLQQEPDFPMPISATSGGGFNALRIVVNN